MLLYLHCQSTKHQYMPRQERTKSGTGIYHVMLRGINRQDHLGNNRAVVNHNGTVEQITHYYPFGAVFSDMPKSPSHVKGYKKTW